MTKYLIHGGNPLHGTIHISGAKNAAVAIIPAALLVDGVCRIENVPQISDVTLILQILQELGADIRTVNRTTVEVDCSHIRNRQVPYELARKIRASYYLVGALLSRFGWAEVPLPGGCDLGGRPVDQHIKGFVAMGAEVDVRSGLIYARVPNGSRLAGGQVYLDIVSVGATMNIMLAATLASGMTVIENAAKEPHVVDVANFLNSMGANIKGAGTDVVRVSGVRKLHGSDYPIIPDQIEAGTFMFAAAITKGDVTVKNVIPKHLESTTAKLMEMGCQVEESDDAVRVVASKRLENTHVKTLPYPGFPTDLQPQISVSLALAKGTSIVTESIFDNRFKYVDELARMGSNIKVEGNVAVIDGVKGFSGASVQWALCQSATNRSRRPMPTGSPFLPRTQYISHWVSWGHTRPQTAGRAEVLEMIWYAASKSPLATSAMNSGICTMTGQPCMQARFLQFKQRWASSRACSSV